MEYLIGVGLAGVVCAFGKVVGFDRDRAFYSMMALVVATYYILFAVLGGSTEALLLEMLVAGLFLAMAVVGFRRNLWWVVVALAGHGVFDMVHHLVIENRGVPVYWPGFCAAYDVVAGGILAVMLMLRVIQAGPVKLSCDTRCSR